MRGLTILMAFAGLTAGCTHNQLRQSTLNQASTLSDLQHKQVLDNLAMIACNPEALPWHSKLTAGLVQVADQGGAGFETEFQHGVAAIFRPSLAAQRGLLEEWSVEPTTAADDLELLYLAYRKATAPGDAEVNEKIYEAICELSLRFDILPSEATLTAIVKWKDAPREVAKLEEKMKELLPKNKDLLEIALKKRMARTKADDEKLTKAYEDDHKYLKAIVQKKDTLEALLDELGIHQVYQTAVVDGQPRMIYRTEVSRPSGYLARSDERKQEILTALEWLCEPSAYLPKGAEHQPAKRNPGIVDQAADKIKKLQELLTVSHFQGPWLCRGCKKDVPKCACYVGRFCGCEGECYVWVMPGHARTLREFTLIILTLAPKESQDMTPLGAAFSPSFR